MIAELLKEELPHVAPQDKIAQAIDILQDEDISELIIAEEGQYLYMIREIDILSSLKETIGELNTAREGHFAFVEDHFLKALQKMHNNDLSILPVVDQEMKLKGALRKDDLLDYLCTGYVGTEQDSIIIIEQAMRDYSLATLSSIIEQEGGKVIGVFNAPVQGSNEKIWVSLTLNTLSLQQIISSLERHDFEIIAHMSGQENETMIKERYESLMTFLNV